MAGRVIGEVFPAWGRENPVTRSKSGIARRYFDRDSASYPSQTANWNVLNPLRLHGIVSTVLVSDHFCAQATIH